MKPYLFSSSLGALIFLLTVGILLASPDTEADEAHVPGEVIVKFQPGLSQEEIAELVAANGASVIEYIEQLGAYRMQLSEDATVPQAIDAFTGDPRCLYAEPNHIGEGGDYYPNDSAFPLQWHLHNIGQSGGTIDADIDAVEERSGSILTSGALKIYASPLPTCLADLLKSALWNRPFNLQNTCH